MIEAIPKPNFWRAPTDNDCGNLMAMRYGQWKLASMYVNHKDYRGAAYGPGNVPKVEEKEHSVKVSYTYFFPLFRQLSVHLLMKFSEMEEFVPHFPMIR